MRSFVLFALLLTTHCCLAATRTIPEAETTRKSASPPTDLVLIYDGSPQRGVWNQERFKPYVYREQDSRVEWLFDGFLFIEYLAKSGARLCPITNRPDAVKRDWLDLIDHYFSPGQSIGALDQLLEKLAAEGHRPKRKRQVVITLPTPITGSVPTEIRITSEWGELDGAKLDFREAQDRIRACSWYVDEVLKRWKSAGFKHVELAGFYWVFERAWKNHNTAEIGAYIRSKAVNFYWIPSWPQGRPNWRDYGFDYVYQQPNYFFHRQPTEEDRLDKASQFASRAGASMEMEFDKGLFKSPEFKRYFDEYIAAYYKHGVWQRKPVAYYEGGGVWHEMALSSDPEIKARFDTLGTLIARRQKKSDEGFAFDQRASALPDASEPGR